MTRTRLAWLSVAALVLGAHQFVAQATQSARTDGSLQVPQFQFDPTWPKQPFPNYEIIGNVIGLAIDAKEHVWVLNRPQMVTEQEQGASLNEIGEAFGGRDHGTVLHACKLVKRRMKELDSVRQTISFIDSSLKR